jgi:DNA polymerase III delta prime subunit
MFNLVGQHNLKSHIDSLISGASLPHFIIIEGEKGAGKNTLVRYIQNTLNWPLYEAPDLKIDSMRAMVDDSTKISSPRLYLIKQGEKMGIPAQNAMLKFAEEPNENAYIIMTCNTLGVLPTIISRARVFSMEPYTKDELREFGDGDLLLDVCTNPGQVIGMQMVSYKKLYELCFKVVDYVGKATVANVFNIANNIDDEDVTKFPSEYFVNMLIYAINSKMKQGENLKLNKEYLRIVYKFKAQFDINGINKKNVLDAMFLNLWKEARKHENL